MQRQQSYASIQMSILLACMFVGCRTPKWWAYRSLRSVPCTSDSATSSHLQACSADNPTPSSGNAPPPPPPAATPLPATPLRDEAAPKSPKDAATISAAPAIRLASHQQSLSVDDKPKVNAAPKQTEGPFKLPADLPGAETPPFSLQRKDADGKPLDAAKQKENVLKLYNDFDTLTIEPHALPDHINGVTRLEDLQQLARQNHPGLRAAAASVESTRGLMIQAGLPPNPNVGYQADTVRTLNTLGYHGAYLQQTFILARKLGLAAQAAAVDYANAEVSQRKTWITVQSNVRRSYFQVLGARKRVVLSRALSELSESAYQAQIKLVVAGDAAPYEPLQLRVLTTQARASVIRAQQDSIAAWRTLAAAVGLPNLAPSALDGRIDCPVPEIIYENALARMTAVHTDLKIAENLIGKNRTLVTLADRVPIPDLNVGFVLQRDYTFTPGTNTYNLMVGGAVPVLNQNQGNRISARAELVRSIQLVADTENQLTGKLAPMFGTYEANRQIAKSFRTEALSDQVRAYRGIYQRYLTEPSGISFNDVIVGQQTVAGVLNQYIDVLQSQWQSTVDLGEMLQVDDLFQMGELSDVAEIPVL